VGLAPVLETEAEHVQTRHLRQAALLDDLAVRCECGEVEPVIGTLSTESLPSSGTPGGELQQAESLAGRPLLRRMDCPSSEGDRGPTSARSNGDAAQVSVFGSRPRRASCRKLIIS
jgi:hypothetical protein